MSCHGQDPPRPQATAPGVQKKNFKVQTAIDVYFFQKLENPLDPSGKKSVKPKNNHTTYIEWREKSKTNLQVC